MKRFLSIMATIVCACSGGSQRTTIQDPEEVADRVEPEEPEPTLDPCAGKKLGPRDPCAGDRLRPAPPPADNAPEVFAPAWTKVGVGQKVSFGVAAIDQDLDETRVTVKAMPASASFDAITQTITWKPTKKDLPAGTFTVEVANLDADGNPIADRTWEHTWTIQVTKKKQKEPVAAKQSAVIETLLTIREAKRLEAVNKKWSFDKFLVRGAELLRATFPPEQQQKLGKLDKKKLFESFLSSLAAAHGNPRLDPKAREFEKKVFGDPKAWKIVAVRPRVDKKFTELRVVYQAVKAPEPVFAMFRVRPTWDVPTLPPEARAYNNKVFLQMVSDHLLVDGAPSAKLYKNAKAHGKAVAKLVDAVLAYDDSATNPWARAGFAALPTEARMGGGSRRNEDGSYRSGDGWAWSVMKPMPNAEGTAQAYVNIGIPGFWTHTVPSPDGTAWVGKCAPKFDPDDPNHVPGYEKLCRKAQGFVDLPDDSSGTVETSKRDAVNLFVDHKKRDMVAMLPLEDGRRDHGEENGLTCAQCHMRNFGMRDYGDPATADPSKGTPSSLNARIATLNFQIIPTTTWEAFTLEFMKDQECKAAKQLEQSLGKPSGLTCPLAPQ
jgi:hypothetical protein